MNDLKTELLGYLRHMLEPLKDRYTEDKTGLELGAFSAGYGMRIARLEGLSRVLWGLTPYWAGGGDDREYRDLYTQALIAGTNPSSDGYWGNLGNSDQRMVEMAAISLNLLMAPEVIWERLKMAEKEKVAAWLYQINEHTYPDNNWNFFNVITNIALKLRGMPYSQDRIDYGIERYENFYLGNGWYSDGVRPQKDYYVSFGIHFYCLIYAKYMESDDPERSRLYIERAKSFAESFLYWFDNEGKALPFGRSLTYRFAQVAFWSIFAVVAGEECSYLGVVKGMIARNFRYWMHQPIFDHAGILTVGYGYPNLIMSEAYNSPGSPYWAFKAFFCISLPDEHPFWSIPEEPMPELDEVKRIAECHMLLQHRDGEVVALTAGQYPTVEHSHAPAKYAKFAYSTRFGFSVPRSSLSLEDNAPDSMLAFQLNQMIYVRRKCLLFEITDTSIFALWSPVEGIRVETTLIPTKNGHLRRHRIQSEQECTAYDCGFAYPGGKDTTAQINDGFAKVYDGNGYSSMLSKQGTGIVIHPSPNTNLLFPLTRIPAIRYEIHKGVTEYESEVMSDMRKGFIAIGKGDCYEIQA